MRAVSRLLLVAVIVGAAFGAAAAVYVLQLHRLGGGGAERSLIPAEILEVLGAANASIKVESPAFSYGGRIPPAYTCNGSDISPPIIVENVPQNAVSIALIMFDPDAPRGVFYHWLLYSIKPRPRIEIGAAVPKSAITDIGLQGVNDFWFVGYGGPCPPLGEQHRYVILVLALDIDIGRPGLSAKELLNIVRGHVLAYGYTYGVYSR